MSRRNPNGTVMNVYDDLMDDLHILISYRIRIGRFPSGTTEELKEKAIGYARMCGHDISDLGPGRA